MPEPSVLTREQQRALLVGLLTGVVAVAFESVAVATAMPAAVEELGGTRLYAWAFTLFVLGMTFATVVAGRIADRRGPVGPLVGGGAVFLVGLLLAGASQTMPLLVLARFLQGLGGGAMNLCLMVVVANVFDESRRATIMTWFSVCWVLPAFVGPPVSALVTRQWGWHWVFWGLVPVVLGAGALSARPLARVRAAHRPHPDGDDRAVPIWAAGGAAAGVALLQVAGQLLGWRGALAAVLALVTLAVCVPRLMPPRFWQVGQGLPAVVWTRACQAGAFFAAETFLPLSWVEQRGLKLWQAGLVLTIGSLGWTLGSWLQSRPWLRYRRDQIIVVGIAATVLGIALVVVSSWSPRGTLWLAVLGWTVAGLGMGLAIASTSLAVMTLSPARSLGRNTSSLQVAEGLGNSLVAGLAGTIFYSLHGRTPLAFAALFALAALAALLGLVTALRIGPVSARANPA